VKLFIVLAMSRLKNADGVKAFDVKYISWDQFFTAVMHKSDDWTRLVEADCVIGGADLSIDYM
jgi:hypothetical protein